MQLKETIAKLLRLRYAQSYYCGATNRVVNSWIGEGQNWLLEGEAEPKVNNKGTSVDVFLNCLYQLTFADGDVYTWDLVRGPGTLLSDGGICI